MLVSKREYSYLCVYAKIEEFFYEVEENVGDINHALRVDLNSSLWSYHKVGKNSLNDDATIYELLDVYLDLEKFFNDKKRMMLNEGRE